MKQGKTKPFKRAGFKAKLLRAKERRGLTAWLDAELAWAYPLSLVVVPPQRVAILDRNNKTICHIEGDLYAIQPFAHQAVIWLNAAYEAFKLDVEVKEHVHARLLEDRAIRRDAMALLHPKLREKRGQKRIKRARPP